MVNQKRGEIQMNRCRNFSLVLYQNENEKDMETLRYIINNFEYAYCTHDKDQWENDVVNEQGELIHKKGELKKEHTHVIINLKNARTIKSMTDELNINYIETCNFYATVRYLIHLGYPQKYQYSKQDIKTNMETRIENALKRDYNSEEQDARILLDFIFNKTNQGFLTFKELTQYALENDCLRELQKKSYFYNQFCDQTGFRRI